MVRSQRSWSALFDRKRCIVPLGMCQAGACSQWLSESNCHNCCEDCNQLRFRGAGARVEAVATAACPTAEELKQAAAWMHSWTVAASESTTNTSSIQISHVYNSKVATF